MLDACASTKGSEISSLSRAPRVSSFLQRNRSKSQAKHHVRQILSRGPAQERPLNQQERVLRSDAVKTKSTQTEASAMLQNTRHEHNERYLSVSATPPIIVFHTHSKETTHGYPAFRLGVEMDSLSENEKTDLLSAFGTLRNNACSFGKPFWIRRDTFCLQEWAEQSWEKTATRQGLLYEIL